MLKTLLAGAVAAFVGSRLVKMNEEGKFDDLKARARDGADRLRQRIDERRAGLQGAQFAPARPLPAPPSASRKARKSPDPYEVSKPAKAHPWPVDPRAMPSES